MPHAQISYFVAFAVAWSLADLAGRASPGLDEVAAALSFRQPGAQR
jgi:magnesium chelatase family protein